MPTVRISDDTFKRLQKYARPLEDTVDDVVCRALDVLDQVTIPDSVYKKLGIQKQDPIRIKRRA